MRTTTIVVGIAALLFAALPGCATSGSTVAPVTEASGRTSSHSFAFTAGGASAASHVERRVLADRSESLNATTNVTLSGAAHPLVLVETARIEPSGRLSLATAELRSGPRARDLLRTVEIDAARGTVTVRDARGTHKSLVLADQPWTYENAFTDIAPLVPAATPVSAWVARRAAQVGERIRTVDVMDRTSRLTLSNQVVFEDGPSALIVVGGEVAEADADFVQEVPWNALRAASSAATTSELSCAPGPA